MSRIAGSGNAFLLVLALLMVTPRAAQAAESYDNCTGFITSIPTTITTQGTWCLKTDLATGISNGNAITVATNNVTIDCNSFKLGGLAAGSATTADGIRATGVSNTRVRNCNIRGFFHGIYFNSGSGFLVEDNRFDGNTYEDINVQGDGSMIRRNRLFDTGQGTSGQADAYGIYTSGTVDVLENIISNVSGTTGSNGYAIGIYLLSNADGSIEGNRIRGLFPSGTYPAYGTYTYSVNTTRMTYSDNQVIGDGTTIIYGLDCNSPSDRAKNNVLNGVTTAMLTCGDAGGNDITP